MILDGGPYDGQDIWVTENEWEQGGFVRDRYRYLAPLTATLAPSPGKTLPIFYWDDPA